MENRPIKVLLVDDDQGDFEMIRVMLKKAEHQEFEVDWVSNFDEALDAFETGGHDVYLLDYFLEDRTGLDLLKEARTRGISAPIIMVTGRGSRSVDMEAMELGASDYLVKGLIDPDTLERAVRHALERREGARAIRELQERSATGMTPGLSGEGPARSPGGGPADQGLTGDLARFRVLFEATQTPAALVRLDGRLMEVNPAFGSIFTSRPTDMEGQSFLDLLDESDREAVAVELGSLADGTHTRYEAARRFLDRDGEMRWAHTTMTLIRNAEGAPDHLIAMLEVR